MRRLNDEERTALREVGPPGEGPVSDATFAELARLGYGRWAIGPTLWDRLTRRTYWYVTAQGAEALRLDTIAREPTS